MAEAQPAGRRPRPARRRRGGTAAREREGAGAEGRPQARAPPPPPLPLRPLLVLLLLLLLAGAAATRAAAAATGGDGPPAGGGGDPNEPAEAPPPPTATCDPSAEEPEARARALARRYRRGAAVARDQIEWISSVFGSPVARRGADAAAWAAGLPDGAFVPAEAAKRIKAKMAAATVARRPFAIGVLGGGAAAGRDVHASYEAFPERLARWLQPALLAAGGAAPAVRNAAAHWAAPAQVQALCMEDVLGGARDTNAAPAAGAASGGPGAAAAARAGAAPPDVPPLGGPRNRTDEFDLVLLSLEARDGGWDADVEGVARAGSAAYGAPQHGAAPAAGVAEALVRRAAALPGAPAVALVHMDDTPPAKELVRWDSDDNPYGAGVHDQACKHEAAHREGFPPAHACWAPKKGDGECPALGPCAQQCFVFRQVEGAELNNRRACAKSRGGHGGIGAEEQVKDGRYDGNPKTGVDNTLPPDHKGYPKCELPHEAALVAAYASSAALHEFSLLPVVGALYYDWAHGSFSFESLMVNSKSGPLRQVYYVGERWLPAPFAHDLKSFVLARAYLSMFADAMDELADATAAARAPPVAAALDAEERAMASAAALPKPRCAALLCPATSAARRPRCLLAPTPHSGASSLRRSLEGAAAAHDPSGGEGMLLGGDEDGLPSGWAHGVAPEGREAWEGAAAQNLGYRDAPVVFTASKGADELRVRLDPPPSDPSAPLLVCALAGTPLAAADVVVSAQDGTQLTPLGSRALATSDALGPAWAEGPAGGDAQASLSASSAASEATRRWLLPSRSCAAFELPDGGTGAIGIKPLVGGVTVAQIVYW